jgi:hypothetical protein
LTHFGPSYKGFLHISGLTIINFVQKGCGQIIFSVQDKNMEKFQENNENVICQTDVLTGITGN